MNKLAAFSLLVSIAVSGLLMVTQAQTATKSPYSRFGVGDLQFRGFAQNFAMGGCGVALNSSKNINIQNPASLLGLNQTTFDAGLNADFVALSTTTLRQRTQTANLGYMALAFPVSKRWASTLGLVPYSSVGYKVDTTGHNPAAGTVKTSYEANGGINRVFIGNAFKVNDKWSIGLNISYLFGSINKVRTVDLLDSTYAYTTRVTDNIHVSDLYFDYGLQYTTKLKNGQILTLGAAGATTYNVNTTNTQVAERLTRSGEYEIYKDSIPGSEDIIKGKIKLPLQFTLGGALRNERWIATAEYNFQQWSKYSNTFGTSDLLANSHTFRAGVQYVPNADAVTEYLKLVQYRAGFHFTQSYLQINGYQLHEIGLSLGIGLPIRKTQNVINLSAEIGQRGTTDYNLIKEQFIRLNLGFSFTDKWFIKRKYD